MNPENTFLITWLVNSAHLERKSIEPIALAVKDGNVQSYAAFCQRRSLGRSHENDCHKYRSLVNDDLGSPVNGASDFR